MKRLIGLIVLLLLVACGNSTGPSEFEYSDTDYDVKVEVTTYVNSIPGDCHNSGVTGCEIKVKIATQYSLNKTTKPSGGFVHRSWNPDTQSSSSNPHFGITDANGRSEYTAEFLTAYSIHEEVCPVQGNGKCGVWEFRAK